jgi:hypothetical protein
VSTTRLKIYNGALTLLGELRLDDTTGLTERREPRYLLDQVWNDGGVRYCLEQAQWHFAMRTARFDYETNVTPPFGLSRAFTKPDDWVETSGVFQDEFMRAPIINYADEAGVWYADLDQIYVRYVSDDADFGLDLARWPETFTEYVKAYFAGKIVYRIPSAAGKIVFLHGPPGRPEKGYVHETLCIAKNKSAMTGPVTFPTRGTWTAARHRGMSRSIHDGGNISSLIG